MSMANLTVIMSEVGRQHPELVSDEKVRRYILLVIEEARRLNSSSRAATAPVDVIDV